MTATDTSSPADQADTLLKTLNARFAVVHTTNKILILDDKPGNGEFRLYTKSDFFTLLSNQRAPGATKQNAAQWWLQHPMRREYDEIVFAPGPDVPGKFNVWRGFGVTAMPGNCELFWKFVEADICDGSAVAYKYVRRWLAHLFQKPAELPETALVLRGRQGTGKNTFADAIGRLVGKHYLSVTNMSQVTGRFNGHLANTLLLNANEAIWGGNKSEEGALKAMVTDRTTAIEFKGKDVISFANYKRLIVSSNNSWAVPLDVDDRRFLVLDVSDRHKEDRVYFSALFEQLTHGGYEALMHDLMQEDLTGFDPRDLPRTAGSLDMKLRSGSTILRWVHELLNAGINNDSIVGINGMTVNTDGGWLPSVSKDDLYGSYCYFCRLQNERRPDTKSEVFKTLRQILPGLADTRPKVSTDRIRQISFPALQRCRESFERHLKLDGRIAWDTTGDQQAASLSTLSTLSAPSTLGGRKALPAA